MRIECIVGDITAETADAIVNAANSGLRGGGGVDGAIHRAAGSRLAEACAGIGGCATGDAVITDGFELPCRHVIHTVGPVWRGGDAGEARLLESCYQSSFDLARQHGIQSISFPAISTGAYGYPKVQAARIAVAVARAQSGFESIRFVCFDKSSADIYNRLLDEQ